VIADRAFRTPGPGVRVAKSGCDLPTHVQDNIDWHMQTTGIDASQELLKVWTGAVLVDQKVELVVAAGIYGLNDG